MMIPPTCTAGSTTSGRQPDDAGLAAHANALQVLEFACQGRHFALPLACVRRAVPSAEPVPLPGASDIVLGVLNVGGETVTVLDFARRAGGAATRIDPSQQFLIVDLGGFACALVADSVNGVRTVEGVSAQWPGSAGAAAFVDGALHLEDGLCLVIHPERFLFEQERLELAAALAGARDERS